MSDHLNLDSIMEMLEEQKKNVIAAALVAKHEFLDTMDKVEETIDDIDTDEIKMKAVMAKLKIMEELEEIQEKLEGLGDKAKDVADASSDEIKESWDAAKKVAAKAEDKVSEIFKKV